MYFSPFNNLYGDFYKSFFKDFGLSDPNYRLLYYMKKKKITLFTVYMIV